MKVLILNGSSRANGNTASALKEAEKVLSKKVGAAVAVARRGGTTATMDQLNKYFLMTNMPVVPSQYWNIVHGCDPGDVVKDEEGMQTMRQMALNMAFMMKSFELGMKQFGSPKIQEEPSQINFIR